MKLNLYKAGGHTTMYMQTYVKFISAVVVSPNSVSSEVIAFWCRKLNDGEPVLAEIQK